MEKDEPVRDGNGYCIKVPKGTVEFCFINLFSLILTEWFLRISVLDYKNGKRVILEKGMLEDGEVFVTHETISITVL